MKTCRECEIEKPLEAFYRNPSGRPGHRNLCKECTAAYSKVRYAKDPQGINRRTVLSRKKKPENQRAASKRHYDRHREQMHEKNRRVLAERRDQAEAVWAVNAAVKAGRMSRPGNCSKCGSADNIQGHHEDYSKQLEVVWLCARCHTELHWERRRAQLQT
jgi:hypothetical protein